MPRRLIVILSVLAILGCAVAYRHGRGIWMPFLRKFTGGRTTEQILAKYGPAAQQRLRPGLQRIAAPDTPEEITLIAYKAERRVELWIRVGTQWRHAKSYPITAASGSAGPKLREGDYQVPEGVYGIDALNPNSSYHLSMRINYPNAFDRRMAARDGRGNLGGDIFLHGKSVSIGCLAIGDEAIEELFVLVAKTGIGNTRVVIAPAETHRDWAAMAGDASPWIGDLYDDLRAELAAYDASVMQAPTP